MSTSHIETLLSQYVDRTLRVSVGDKLVRARIDLSAPCTVLDSATAGTVSCAMEYQVRNIYIPELPDEVKTIRIGVIVRHGCAFTELVLGQDWRNAVIKQYSTSHRSLCTMNYVESLFSRLSPNCIQDLASEALYYEALAHGLAAESRNRDEYSEAFIRHLFSGDCVDNPAPGCALFRTLVGCNNRRGLVAYLIGELKVLDTPALPIADLRTICKSVKIPIRESDNNINIMISLTQYVDLFSLAEVYKDRDLSTIDEMDQRGLAQVAHAHGLNWMGIEDEVLKSRIFDHLLNAECLKYQWNSAPARDLPVSFGCVGMSRSHPPHHLSPTGASQEMQIGLLERSIKTSSARGLRRVLSVFGWREIANSPLRSLRRLVTNEIKRIKKGKQPIHESIGFESGQGNGTIPVREAAPETRAAIGVGLSGDSHKAQPHWPSCLSRKRKEHLISLFREATGVRSLATFICAVCGERKLCRENLKILDLCDFNTELLTKNWRRGFEEGSAAKRSQSLFLDKGGLVPPPNDAFEPKVQLCKDCRNDLTRKSPRLPPFALANDMDLGDVPTELQELTPVEESMIALCRAKAWIVHLTEDSDKSGSEKARGRDPEKKSNPTPKDQKGLRGHAIIFPQRPDKLMQVLPPPVEDVTTHICVVFVGSRKPSDDWIRENVTPLIVRREKIRNALVWLKTNNPLYSHVVIDDNRLQALPVHGILPIHVQHHATRVGHDLSTSSYDPNRKPDDSTGDDIQAVFDSIVVADVDGNASFSALSAAAIRHLMEGRGVLQIGHENDPVNEFYNPKLFPMIYPTLFPYGRGGFEEPGRRVHVSMERQVAHFLRLGDRRFQRHHSFMFVAFNMLQRRQALRQTKFKVSAPRFAAVARKLAGVSQEAVHAITERLCNGEPLTARNPEEETALQLMNEVRMVTRHVSGSAASRTAMRNEIRGLMMSHGLPSFFITINPADVHNPLVRFLAGEEIDIDRLLPEQASTYWSQAVLIAKNPVIAAEFFNTYMKAFIKHILGHGSEDPEVSALGGIVGRVKAYYGCVEAQGRGSLHCHMLVWVDGALNPNQIRDKIIADPNGTFTKELIEMLDDTISTACPYADSVAGDLPKVHPCRVRGIHPSEPNYSEMRKAEIYHLVKQCQTHEHGPSCEKYWRGPPDPERCRYGMDERRVRPITTVDTERGEIYLRRIEGMINNFNETILEALRCNMDIKFIGSGPSAKAVLYYITDYITKTQLKTHVAFSALELAVQKLGESNRSDDESPVARAKRLLNKCVYAMLSQQEVSGQQVASYLLGLEDHFTSHEFRCLWWTSFESALDRLGGALRRVNSEEIPKNVEHAVTSDSRHESGGNLANEGTDMLYENEEVTIEHETEGLAPRSGLVADYVLRGTDFEKYCIWDFISSIVKVRSRKARNVQLTGEDVASGLGMAGDPSMDMVGSGLLKDIIEHEDEPPSKLGQCFLPGHMEHKTHFLRLRRQSPFVPVLLGPAIPRRDRPELYERFCRLMLIIFQPWRAVSDLKRNGQTWEAAFAEFVQTASQPVRDVIDNMQILNECRDGRDDDIERRKRRPALGREDLNIGWLDDGRRDEEEDEAYASQSREVVLELLQSLQQAKSANMARLIASGKECITAAEKIGLFPTGTNLSDEPFSDSTSCHHEIGADDVTNHESDWKTAYEQQRDARKSRAMETQIEQNKEINSVDDLLQIRHIGPRVTSVEDTCEVDIRRLDPPARDDFPSVSIDGLINEFSLNAEQSRAFKIICQAAESKGKHPLMMHIGGSGGTGKSRIIKAVKEFFTRRNESRRLRLASFTGVAAHNISGVTLHAALCMNDKIKFGAAKRRRELRRLWDGVDFLFIDEVSMIGCRRLYEIHRSLVEAKGKIEPFGGINIVFAGDFAQLAPVGDRRLFTRLKGKLILNAGTVQGQEDIMGKLLWLQVKEVVMLKQQMRQEGPENREFVGLLERLRVGSCTDSDYELLQSRVVKNLSKVDSELWTGVPIVVAENGVRDLLNEKATEAYAKSINKPISWYYATDQYNGSEILDPDILETLSSFNSGQTGYRSYRVPLVEGMPVILAQNYDVENGVVNGTFGILRSVRYTTSQSHNRRRARSCVIESDAYTGDTLPHLTPGQFVALEDQVTVKFMHPYSGQWCEIKRTQIPLSPAYAITVYKAQGLTFPRVVVDLESCKNLESAYVMLSRAKSLQGVVILRHFERKKITVNPSEEIRKEFSRLERLNLETILKHSDDPIERLSIESWMKNNGRMDEDEIEGDDIMDEYRPRFQELLPEEDRIRPELQNIPHKESRKRRHSGTPNKPNKRKKSDAPAPPRRTTKTRSAR